LGEIIDMKDDVFLDLMQILIRRQLVVSVRTTREYEKSYYALVAIGVGSRDGETTGAFVDVVRRFETHADKDSIVFVSAEGVREIAIDSTTQNYPLNWLRIVESELKDAVTLRTIFPESFAKPKKLSKIQSEKTKLKVSRSGKRILEPKFLR
jgi:hypothetical protein